MKIYTLLKRDGDVSVSSVVDYLSLTQPTVSYHLHEMEKAGLLMHSKKGKNVYYSLRPTCPIYNRTCILTEVKFPERAVSA